MNRPNPSELPTGKRLMRLNGLMKKEFHQIVRDPSSIAIAFVLPVILLILFGYGVSLDAEHVPIALVVEHPGTETASFVGGFQESRYFRPKTMNTIQVAEEALMHREVDGIVWLRGNFAREMRGPGSASIGVIVNGVDANQARIIEGYVTGVWSKWQERLALERDSPLSVPVAVEQRIWFNAEMRSRSFLVPGLIAIIMTLIGALLTAMVVAREWERGTMEALMVTPVRVQEILLGKIIPYFILGMGGMTLSVAMAVWVFDVPFRGSYWVLFATAGLFLLTSLAMGLLISVAAKNQFVAGQIAIIATFLPAFILSGFLFDIGSMPKAVQFITHIIAARYFVSILQTLFLAGDVWSVVAWNSLALGIMCVLFLVLVRKRMKKRLE
ncbi:MAG: ABC transporter permease [Deltaproteobacteria bacterium]|nr:ABC transporter permease [Deltaproteobacteria bacterium]